MKVYINYENSAWKKYSIDFEKIAQMSAGNKYKNSEVSITLVNDKYIHILNKKYRNIDKPTNVLSFELNDDILMGDIFISLDTVKKEARQQGISVEEHIAHMVVHGMLHLQGFDHLTDKDACVMEQREVKILKKLGYNNPYEESITTNNKIWKSIILYALCGIVGGLGFAPFNMIWLSLLSIGIAYYITINKTQKISFIKSWLITFSFGAMYGLSMFWWVVHSIYVIPDLTQQFAIWTIPALIGIGIICGIIFSIPFAVIRYISVKSIYRPILFSCLWTLILWLREWIFTGFPWNPLANITINIPMIANSMALWGALGLTFIITGLISSFTECITNRFKKNCVLFVYCILFVVGCIYGVYNIHKSAYIFTDNLPILRIVQPATSEEYKLSYINEQDRINLDNQKLRDLFILGTMDKTVTPDIIIFPETSFPYIISDNNFPFSHILNTNVIMGANSYKGNRLYNSMIVADNLGQIRHLYHKSHLVPFGEYRPFGNLIKTPGQLTAGNGPEIITLKTDNGNFVFAPAICYEIIFSDSLIKDNVYLDAIINITNDTWFGDTPGTYQHLDMVRRYAIESGLPVVRADYSGISAFITSSGNIDSQLSIGRKGSIDGIVYGAHKTIYRIIGRNRWMIIILMFSIIVSISISLSQKKD